MNYPDLKPGHFVKLKNDYYQQNIDSLGYFGKVNVFEIEKFADKAIHLKNLKHSLPVDKIEPIPINEEDDRWIYADIVLLPNLCSSRDANHRIPIEEPEYCYYRHKKIMIDNTLLDDIIENNKFIYVHEVQDYLSKESEWCSLKINHMKS